MGRREASITRPRIFCLFLVRILDGMGVWGRVGIVVLTSRAVRCCKMESFLGYMSQCSRSNNVFTMEVQTRIYFCTSTSIMHKPFDHMKREVSYTIILSSYHSLLKDKDT